MDGRIKFVVGLDVHKDSISIAACDMSREPARFAGTVNSAEGVRGLRAMNGRIPPQAGRPAPPSTACPIPRS